MTKVKLGAYVKDVPNGSLKWYKMAGWKVLKKKRKKNESNTEKNATA